jgi:hypothetical protein
VVGDGDTEHGVAEELEPLVRRPPGVLGAPGSVDHGRAEDGRVVDGMAQSLVELLEASRRQQGETAYSFATT